MNFVDPPAQLVNLQGLPQFPAILDTELQNAAVLNPRKRDAVDYMTAIKKHE